MRQYIATTSGQPVAELRPYRSGFLLSCLIPGLPKARIVATPDQAVEVADRWHQDHEAEQKAVLSAPEKSSFAQAGTFHEMQVEQMPGFCSMAAESKIKKILDAPAPATPAEVVQAELPTPAAPKADPTQEEWAHALKIPLPEFLEGARFGLRIVAGTVSIPEMRAFLASRPEWFQPPVHGREDRLKAMGIDLRGLPVNSPLAWKRIHCPTCPGKVTFWMPMDRKKPRCPTCKNTCSRMAHGPYAERYRIRKPRSDRK